MFISQPKGPTLNQLNFVVEALGHPIGIAMPNGARNRFKPPTSRPRHALEGCQRTLTRLLNALPKRRASRFILLPREPLAQVLHPVNPFPERREAPAPVGPRHHLVHLQLIG